MSHGPFIRALREYGVRGTFEKLYKMRTIKFGQLVGVDSYGNQYFENTKDYPHGSCAHGAGGGTESGGDAGGHYLRTSQRPLAGRADLGSRRPAPLGRVRGRQELLRGGRLVCAAGVARMAARHDRGAADSGASRCEEPRPSAPPALWRRTFLPPARSLS
jgi:hypothetical protein